MQLASSSLALPLALVLVGVGCKREPSSPEAQVREVMRGVQEAAKKADVKTLKALISDSYHDATGKDRQAIGQLLTFHYMRHRDHHVFSIVRDVHEIAPDAVKVTALAALAGQPVKGPEALSRIHADLFRFTFQFALEDDEWLCVRVDWERARAPDFLD